MKDNKQPIMSATDAQQLAGQFEEIVNYYQGLLDQAVREKQEAVVQAELAKAKARSLEAERDSLADSLRAQGARSAGTPSTDAQRISALEAERDNLQAALKSADQRMRELEIELNMTKKQQAVETAPAAPVAEPAPEVTPAAEYAPAAAPVEESVPAAAPAVESAQTAEAEPAEPDFEEQKEMLRRMEEELARLEERLKRDS